jgi:hypothetical protein
MATNGPLYAANRHLVFESAAGRDAWPAPFSLRLQAGPGHTVRHLSRTALPVEVPGRVRLDRARVHGFQALRKEGFDGSVKACTLMGDAGNDPHSGRPGSLG